MGKYFGTDGVRGVANVELTAEFAFKLGRAGALVLARRAVGARKASGARSLDSGARPCFLIGKDTRLSCDMLEGAIVAGICSTGADAVSIGVLPTPAIAYLTVNRAADAGIVISASHNPFEYNGIKFIGHEGYKLIESIEKEIEDTLEKLDAQGGTPQIAPSGKALEPSVGAALEPSFDMPFVPPSGAAVGRHRIDTGAADEYAAHLMGTAKIDLSGIKVALDCSNGAASFIAPPLFRALGAEVFVINNTPDGVNINSNCGSTHIGAVGGYAVSVGADIGFAFDGDADRVLAVDENGALIDGDNIMAMLAIDMKKRGTLAKDTVAATVMSNLGFELALREHGIGIVRTDVGDHFVLEEMLEHGYNLGGENSGHIICLDGATTGDGILAALRLLEVLCANTGSDRTGCRASKLAAVYGKVPQVLLNARVSNSKKNLYMDDPVIRGECERIEAMFSGKGRVLIRPSGTEPLVRVMIEAVDESKIMSEAKSLVKLIEERLNAE